MATTIIRKYWIISVEPIPLPLCFSLSLLPWRRYNQGRERMIIERRSGRFRLDRVAGRGLARIIVEKAGQRQLITGTAFKYVIVGLMLTFLAHHRLLPRSFAPIFSQHLSSHSRTRLPDISFAAGKCINLSNLAARRYKDLVDRFRFCSLIYFFIWFFNF